MKRYNALDLLTLSSDELWALPKGPHLVVFPDGEVPADHKTTILSVTLWHPLTQTEYKPMSKRFHLGDRRFSGGVVLDIVNDVIWAMHEASGETLDTEELALYAIQTINKAFNEWTTRLASSVMSLSMFDLVEIADHPRIKEINSNIEPTQYGIEDVAYRGITEVVENPAELKGNPIAEAVRSGSLKMSQVLQIVGPRGFNTDINSEIFPEPILTGYLEGIEDLYGSTIESRSGTKSLLYNKELLRKTEYFNRKTQLIAQYVQRLHPGDCGTPHTIEFPVMPNLLKQLKGKYYYDAGGALTYFQGDEKHLVGTKVRLRSVLGCTHPDPAGICAICYGRLSFSIPRGTNIGHVSAVNVGDKITSTVLSTKHLDSTAKVENLVLGKTEVKYLHKPSGVETIYLKKNLQGKSLKLVVSASEVENLPDVKLLDDLSEYPVANASQLTRIRINTYNGEEGVDSDVLTVSLYNRKASFSREFLEYLSKVGWETDDRGQYLLIDLSKFDTSKPFLSLPFRHVNMYEVMQRIQSFLHSGSDSTSGREVTDETTIRVRRNYLRRYKDPAQALLAFATMINEKLKVNLVHCEILVYAMMVRSSTQRDYRLPIPGVHGVFESYETLMVNRSLAGAMAYQKQDRPMLSPGSFIYKHRNDHPYDMITLGGKMA